MDAINARVAELGAIVGGGPALASITTDWLAEPFELPEASTSAADELWAIATQHGSFNHPRSDPPGLVGSLGFHTSGAYPVLRARPTWMYCALTTSYLDQVSRWGVPAELVHRLRSQVGSADFNPSDYDSRIANPITVNVIVYHPGTDSILLQRRGEATLSGDKYMVSAGGFSEPADRLGSDFNPWATAIREAREETGMDLSHKDVVPLHAFRSRTDKGLHFAGLVIRADRPRLRTTAEHEEVAGYRWIAVSDAERFARLCPEAAEVAVYSALRELRRGKDAVPAEES